MATTVKYTGPNRAALSKLLNGPELRAALAGVCTEGKGIAQSLAADFTKTGDYESKFEVGEGLITIRGIERQTGKLINTSDHAAAVEWGKGKTATAPAENAHRTLGRTLDQLRGPK